MFNHVRCRLRYVILSGGLVEDSRGKITGQRVLDAEMPKMETSFAMEGNYRGTAVLVVWTAAGKSLDDITSDLQAISEPLPYE